MIIVVGSPLHVPADDDRPAQAVGLPARIARAAVIGGSTVQLVGKVGDDPAGDATLIALARDGVGHAAVLRDPSRATPAAPPVSDEDSLDEARSADDAVAGEALAAEASAGAPEGGVGATNGLPRASTLEPADIELALRYLDGFDVIVVAEQIGPEGMAVVTAAAAYAGGSLVVLVPDVAPPAVDLTGATILSVPEADPDGVFARTVGEFAAALDAGIAPAEAFHAAMTRAGWERTGQA